MQVFLKAVVLMKFQWALNMLNFLLDAELSFIPSYGIRFQMNAFLRKQHGMAQNLNPMKSGQELRNFWPSFIFCKLGLTCFSVDSLGHVCISPQKWNPNLKVTTCWLQSSAISGYKGFSAGGNWGQTGAKGADPAPCQAKVGASPWKNGCLSIENKGLTWFNHH